MDSPEKRQHTWALSQPTMYLMDIVTLQDTEWKLCLGPDHVEQPLVSSPVYEKLNCLPLLFQNQDVVDLPSQIIESAFMYITQFLPNLQ
jgi:hypothetical protein